MQAKMDATNAARIDTIHFTSDAFLIRLEFDSKNLYRALATISNDTCFPMVYGTMGVDYTEENSMKQGLEWSKRKNSLKKNHI